MPPHVGRGGWTWYTGSAGWIYRAGLESILGFQLQGEHLLMNPCIPKEWPNFSISFKYRTSRYDIAVANPSAVSSGVVRTIVDGAVLNGPSKIGVRISLVNDGATHAVQLTLG
jgi:cyclic beta-1,2-glucan synthetase